jgi:hypothetical protein
MRKLLASLAGLALCAGVGVASAEVTTLSPAQLDGVTGASNGGNGGESNRNRNSTRQTNAQLIGVNALNGNNVALIQTNPRGGDSANQNNSNRTRQSNY